MNALTLLKQDHGNVDHLFSRFETLGSDADDEEKGRVRDLVIEQLSVHAAVEEQIFYPAVRQRLDDDFPVLEGLEEHHIVKWTLSELEGMSPSAERFDAKMTVLIESVRHHVGEEEDDLFPKVRSAFTVEELNELGDSMAALKSTAPTRPHPRTPDTPPFNTLLALPLVVADRAVRTGLSLVVRAVKMTPLGH